MTTRFKWFVVDVSFVWPNGFVASHREFPEMEYTPEAAKQKTLDYLSSIGATDVEVHSVVPERQQQVLLQRQDRYRQELLPRVEPKKDTPKFDALPKRATLF